MPVRMVLEGLGRQIYIELRDAQLSSAKKPERHLYTVHVQSLRNEILDHCGFVRMDCNLVRASVA